MMHFKEFSNVHNSDGSSKATRSALQKSIYDARSRLFCRIAKKSIAVASSSKLKSLITIAKDASFVIFLETVH